jgi:ferrochelatase
VQAHAARILAVLSQTTLSATDRAESALVLTAHSLPTAAIAAGDPYEGQVRSSAEAIGRALGTDYRLAFQSQGADGGPWLGPDLKQTLRELAETGVRRVVVAPFGFLAEHVETLYDLDVEAVEWARELGLRFERVGALNDDATLVEALAHVAFRTLSRRVEKTESNE